jgi:hypothetical protein
LFLDGEPVHGEPLISELSVDTSYSAKALCISTAMRMACFRTCI